jgi:hypothetical protein
MQQQLLCVSRSSPQQSPVSRQCKQPGGLCALLPMGMRSSGSGIGALPHATSCCEGLL